MTHELVIYRMVDVPVKLRTGKQDYGDIPCMRFNEITKKMEAVDNPRGLAYASRNQLRYRRKK